MALLGRFTSGMPGPSISGLKFGNAAPENLLWRQRHVSSGRRRRAFWRPSRVRGLARGLERIAASEGNTSLTIAEL